MSDERTPYNFGDKILYADALLNLSLDELIKYGSRVLDTHNKIDNTIPLCSISSGNVGCGMIGGTGSALFRLLNYCLNYAELKRELLKEQVYSYISKFQNSICSNKDIIRFVGGHHLESEIVIVIAQYVYNTYRVDGDVSIVIGALVVKLGLQKFCTIEFDNLNLE